MDQQILVEVRTFGQKFTNTPNEKFLLMILGAQGKLENDQKGLNVKRGLRARCEQGLWPSEAPTGYLNDKNRDKKCHVIIDPKRAPVIKQMFEKVGNDGWSGRKVYRWLKDDINFKTKNGKHLTLSNIYRILANPFYTGTFEYPTKSGNWYTGVHTPIISKDLYEKTKVQLSVQVKVQSKNKEFAFTKMITCSSCGSGITAQEKYKNLKNGTVSKYIYYGCTRAKDLNCKEGYLEEKVLISQLTEIVDQIDLDKSGIKKKLKNEIERHKKFHSGIMGMKEEEYSVKDMDIRNYAKYLLSEGSIFEKRDLLINFKSHLTLYKKNIALKI